MPARSARDGPTPGSAQQHDLSPPHPLDPTDTNILRVLRDEGRISISELGNRVNVSRANAYARVAHLRAWGVIQGFTIRVDPKKAGLGIGALVAVSVQQHRWRSILAALSKMNEVEYCAVTAGDFDIVILVRAPKVETIRDVILERLHSIDGVESTRTFFILDETIHRSVVLP
ncbi:MAG: Lrp/AsnC family transcriptional regulator [Acidimicrobiales bacterium]